MNKVWKIATVAGIAAILALGLFLYTWDIPAPQEKVEQELSDDRLAR